MELTTDQMNVLFKGMQLAQEYVRKHAGLRMGMRLEFVEKPGTPREMMRVICESIQEEEARYHDHSRKRDSVELRGIAAFMMRAHYKDLTLGEMGKLLGGEKAYDHSTVSNLLKCVEDLIETHDNQFMNKYKRAELAVELWLKD